MLLFEHVDFVANLAEAKLFLSVLTVTQICSNCCLLFYSNAIFVSSN